MITLPWWMFGTYPDSDEEVNQTEDEKSTEIQTDSMVGTPVKAYETPSGTIMVPSPTIDIDASDSSFSRFLSNIKKRPSNVLEETASKKRRESEKNEKSKELSMCNRTDTVLMNKSKREEEMLNPLFGLELDVSPKAAVNVLYDQNQFRLESEEQEDNNVSIRDFPTFFTSFNDTTVLFNTTINGDIDIDSSAKRNSLEEWDFRHNQYLNYDKFTNAEQISDKPFFKPPVSIPESETNNDNQIVEKISEVSQETKKKRKENAKTRKESVSLSKKKSDLKKERLPKKGKYNKKQKEGNSTPEQKTKFPPDLVKRSTPSRKAKQNVNYKNNVVE